MIKLLALLCAVGFQSTLAFDSKCENVTKPQSGPILSQLVGTWLLSHAGSVPKHVTCIKLSISAEGSSYRYSYTGSKAGTPIELSSGLVAEDVLRGELLFLESIPGSVEKIPKPNYIINYKPGSLLLIYACNGGFDPQVLVQADRATPAAVQAIETLKGLGYGSTYIDVNQYDC